MGQWANGTTTIIEQNNSISWHVQWDNGPMGQQQSSESCTRVPVTTIQSVAMYNETRKNHPDNKTIRTTKSSDNNHHRTTTMKENNHEGQPPSSDNNHQEGHSPPCPATPRFLAKRNWCWRWNATRTFPDHRPSVAIPVWCGHGCFATTPTVAWRTKRTTHWIDGGYECPCCLAPPFKQTR